jgi:phospholipase C
MGLLNVDHAANKTTAVDPGRFYMINNLSRGFLPNGKIHAANILMGGKVPPSSLRTIGDELSENNISWAYYGRGFNAAVRVADGSTDPVDLLLSQNYCDICNPFSYANSIMGDPKQRTQHIHDAIDFFNGLASGHLPSVAFVKPDCRRPPGELEARSLRGHAREHPCPARGPPGPI